MNNEFKYKKELINNLMELISIPSVYSDEGRAGMPFGKGVADALDKFLEIAADLGFKTQNHNGYVGEVEIGQGDYTIGVLCHIDVVEGGKGWDTDPFIPYVSDEKVYGRGSSDNKGPMLTALYAIKRLEDDGLIPNDVAIRMIIGTNEEENWDDMKYYLEKVDNLPNISIVPDGFYPLVYTEKGLYDFNLHYDFSDNENAAVKVLELNGGDARNIVPAEAICIVEADYATKSIIENEIKRKGYDGEVFAEGQNLTIKIKGKSCHAMNPERGVNAISQMLDILSVCCTQSFITAYNRVIGTTYNGEKCGCDFEDEDSGKLTFNIGTIAFTKGSININANIRYPASLDFQTVDTALLASLNSAGFDVEFVDHLLPVRFERDSQLIQLLMKAYQEVSGDFVAAPLAIGGATYARAIPNAVSFGTLFPDEEELAHQANEYISIASIKKSMDILYRALQLLMEEKI